VSQGYTALLAGGCVRDMLLGRVPKDFDVATTARPEQVRAVFGKRSTLEVGASFGVILVRGSAEGGDVEVATFRREGTYSDGRHPDAVEFCSPEEDARRRDFTINGIFFDPIAETVHDFVDGRADLARNVLRAIGTPRERMIEDKLRMLRAVRFAAGLGFEVDPATADAIRGMASQLSVVSAERIAQELRRMLSVPSRARALSLCRELELLAPIFPDLANWVGSETVWSILVRTLDYLDEGLFTTSLAAICHAAVSGMNGICVSPVVQAVAPQADRQSDQLAKLVAARLSLSNDELAETAWLARSSRHIGTVMQQTLADRKRLLGHPCSLQLLDLFRAQLLARDADLSSWTFCRSYLAQTPSDVLVPTPLVTGEDLIERGQRPGPKFKGWLATVFEAQLNEKVNDRAAAIRLLDQLLVDDVEVPGQQTN
jgi:poly(A) polymerase